MVDKFPCWQMEWCFPWKCQFSAIQPLTRKKAEKTPKISQTPQKIHPKKSSPNLRNWNRKRKKKWQQLFFNISELQVQKVRWTQHCHTLLSSLPPPQKKTIHKIRVRFRNSRFPEFFVRILESSSHLFWLQKNLGAAKLITLFLGGFFPEISMIFRKMIFLDPKKSPTI